MFDTASEISIPDNKSENVATTYQFSLPLIPQKPASRANSSHRNKFTKNKKKIFQLPSINNDEQNKQQTSLEKKEVKGKNDNKVHQTHDKNKFVQQVQDKLKFVLGGVPAHNNIEEGNSVSSEEFDFEAKVNANKQIIKEHRKKKQNPNHKIENNQNNRISHHIVPKKSQNSYKPNNLYNKRVKQYKDQSVENKYLQRRKQILQKNSNNSPVRESLKQIRSKDYSSFKIEKNKNNSSHKKMLPKSQSSHKPNEKSAKESNKNFNLFDGIQNYLENPQKNLSSNQKPPLVGLSLLKAKRDLQDKIKLINQKLSIVTEDQQQKIPSNNQNDKNLGKITETWRKVEINHKKIGYEESNFEKQLERISSLQQRNSVSLQKYLQHQTILLELNLRKKQNELKKEVSTQ